MNLYNNIIIHPFSSSVQEKRFLLSCNGLYYETSLAVTELVETLQQYQTEEEGIAAYIYRKEGKYTQEQVQQVINKFIKPLFAATEKKRTFLYEKELFSAVTIDRFSDRFRFLFNKLGMLLVLLVTFILDACFFLVTDNLLLFNSQVTVYVIVGLFVFMLLSSFFHELGHASACKYFVPYRYWNWLWSCQKYYSGRLCTFADAGTACSSSGNIVYYFERSNVSVY